MFRTPSVLGPLNSGFVPFASGAPIDAVADAERQASALIARAAPTPIGETFESGEATRAAWAPASSARIRAVEALVVAAICAYFAFGLLGAVFGR